MIRELNDLKFCLKVMDGPDYQPLVENNKEIERLQEELSLVGYQLITEKQNNEMIMKEINGNNYYSQMFGYCYDNRNKRKDKD